MSFGTFPAGKSCLKIIISLFFCFLPFLSFSQSRYKPGLVVTSQGDTLKGFINYRKRKYNPEEINFKTQLADSGYRLFSPQTARYFAIDGGEVYEAHRVSISPDEVAPGKHKQGMDTTQTTASVFLKLLLNGKKVSLYLLKDKVKERFYILEQGQLITEELTYRVYLGNTQMATSALYKQQLAALAIRKKVFTLAQQIQLAAYARPDLMKIIREINGITDKPIIKKPKQGPSLRWFASAGLKDIKFAYKGINEIVIDKIGEDGNYVFKEVITHSYQPSLSAGADVYLNPTVQRFIIRGELSIVPSRSEVRATWPNPYSTNTPQDRLWYHYELGLVTISAAPQFLFNVYNTDKLKWHLGAGSALNYRKTTYNKLNAQRLENGNLLVADERIDYYELRKLSLAVILRSGIRLKQKVDLSILYSPPARINYENHPDYQWSTLQERSLQLSAGYFF